MASTPSSTAAALAAAKDQFTDIEDALGRLIRANYAPQARTRAAASDGRISAPFEPTPGPADHQGADGARGRRSPRKRGILARLTIARVAIAVCLGVAAVWAWSPGAPAPGQASAPPAIETSAPAPAQAASIATARDLAALRQTVAQLAAGQEQLTRELAKLEAVKPQADEPPEKPDERLRRVSAPPAPSPAAPARKLAVKTPISPQTARRRSPSVVPPPPRPAPQIPPQPQLSALPLLRPPMPVPLP